MHEQDLLAPTVLGAVARRKRLTVLVVILFAVLGLALSLTQKAVATATESLVVLPATASAVGTTSTDPTFLPDQVAILGLTSTADAAAALLAKSNPGAGLTGDVILKHETILGGTTSNLITVSYTNQDPAVAKAAADALVTAYSNILATTAAAALYDQSNRLNTAIQDLDKQIAAAGGPTTPQGNVLANTRSGLVTTRAGLLVTGATGPTISDSAPARLPDVHRTLPPAAGLLLGGIVGLIPAVALAYLLAQKRRRFTNRFQPQLVLQRQLLSEIPSFASEGLTSDVPTADALESAASEAFRFVGASLDAHDYESGPLILAITGGNSLDGKTSVAANLAVTFARRGRRTVAVDADLDGQGLGFLLLGDKRHAPGLAELLAERGTLDKLLQHVPADVGADLLVLPSGLLHGPSVTETVSQENLGQVLADLSNFADVIVVDIPSPLQVAYASSMLRAVGTCVVVVPHESDPVRLNELAARLTGLTVDPIGYVYTKAPLRKELGLASRYVTDMRRVPVAVSPAGGHSTTRAEASKATLVPAGPPAGAGAPAVPVAAVPETEPVVAATPVSADLSDELLHEELLGESPATITGTDQPREAAPGLGWPTMMEEPWVGSER